MIIIKFKNIEEIDLNCFSKLIYNDIQKFYNKQSEESSDTLSKNEKPQSLCQGEKIKK